MKSKSTAWWEGNLKRGTGGMKVGRDVCQIPFSFGTRFDKENGSNPEELLAAAHAGCFSMAFSNMLSEAGHVPARVDTQATVKLEFGDDGPAITHVMLTCSANVPGIDEDTFQEIAAKAKSGCPVSKLFNAKIELQAELSGGG